MPIPHLEDQHGRSRTSNVTPTPTKLKTSYAKFKIPTQTQKRATDHFGAHFLGRCGSRPLHPREPYQSHTHRAGSSRTKLKLKSRPPIVGKRWSINLHRHPDAKITQIRTGTTCRSRGSLQTTILFLL